MAAPQRVLVIGRSGQVAHALQAAPWPPTVAVEARGRESLDLRNFKAVAAAIAERPWFAVVNAAAYTQVDRAESNPDEAFAVNRDGTKALAAACARAGVPLVHLSTDYVFDGTKAEPYREDDPVSPVSVYGASKAEGEVAVRIRLDAHVILRTSWVFSPIGDNFVKTMLRLGAERTELRIVNDQRGRPSAAKDIAAAIVQIVLALIAGKSDGFGTFHFANAGATTWYGFAREIFRQAERRGFAPVPRLTAIPTRGYPTPARRPMNSVLDTEHIARVYGVNPPRWEDALSETLDALLGPVVTRLRGGVVA